MGVLFDDISADLKHSGNVPIKCSGHVPVVLVRSLFKTRRNRKRKRKEEKEKNSQIVHYFSLNFN